MVSYADIDKIVVLDNSHQQNWRIVHFNHFGAVLN